MLDELAKLKQFLPLGEDKNEELLAENTGEKNNKTRLQANLRLWLERQKGNRVATIVKGFEGENDELESLAKTLKSHLGVGGTAKLGEIILQGDHRDKVFAFLQSQGHKVKKAGG